MNIKKHKRIFRKRLVELLKKHKITQSELAKRLEVHQSTVSYFISGKNFPLGETLLRLALVLNCSVDYVLGLD
jgi:transcriptional regulator with XRE-family HTH domain